MKKHYGAQVTSKRRFNLSTFDIDCYRFQRQGRSFQLVVRYETRHTDWAVTVDSLLLEERIMPSDDHGEAKDKPVASLDHPPGGADELRRWVNRQLIAAFLDEHCETPPPTARGL